LGWAPRGGCGQSSENIDITWCAGANGALERKGNAAVGSRGVHSLKGASGAREEYPSTSDDPSNGMCLLWPSHRAAYLFDLALRLGLPIQPIFQKGHRARPARASSTRNNQFPIPQSIKGGRPCLVSIGVPPDFAPAVSWRAGPTCKSRFTGRKSTGLVDRELVSYRVVHPSGLASG
jgi:hypothetical protein